ncbi:MAG: phage replisome organizer N-terminal domain-containing protein [Roseburia sp.]|nr:phage replisome organizer N-terminal domain-containing protein [Roseburia sp.]
MADNRKYYYLKFKENFFESDEIKILENMKEGYIYSNILLKLYLRSLRNEGRLMYKDIIPYTPEILATLIGHQVGTVEKALKIFRKLGLIEILDNGAIYMLDIQNYIGKSSTEADRQREYYNRIKSEKTAIQNRPVLEGPKAGDDVPVQLKETSSKKAINDYSTEFERFWSMYPRKVDKAQAYKKYNARLNDGFSPDELYTAVCNYAEQCQRDKTESKYIKHAKTFLGESTPFLDYLPKNDAQGCVDVADDGTNPFRK